MMMIIIQLVWCFLLGSSFHIISVKIYMKCSECFEFVCLNVLNLFQTNKTNFYCTILGMVNVLKEILELGTRCCSCTFYYVLITHKRQDTTAKHALTGWKLCTWHSQEGNSVRKSFRLITNTNFLSILFLLSIQYINHMKNSGCCFKVSRFKEKLLTKKKKITDHSCYELMHTKQPS